MMKEQHNDFRNEILAGANIMYEYKPKNGLLFDPVKRPCLGESLLGALALRGANEAAPSSDCITCNNLPDNAPVTVEAKVQYKLSWLKGWPLIPSIAAGPAVSWNQGGNPGVRWGFVVTPEVEGIVLQKAGLPTISCFAQYNAVIGTMPSDWRAGFRVYGLLSKKK
jgi:hypothetical protein